MLGPLLLVAGLMRSGAWGIRDRTALLLAGALLPGSDLLDRYLRSHYEVVAESGPYAVLSRSTSAQPRIMAVP